MKAMKRIVWSSLAVAMPLLAAGEELNTASEVATQVEAAADQSDAIVMGGETPPGGHTSFVTKLINYFRDTNKRKEHKKFDVSFIGGPYYTSDIGVGIGVVASGVYGHGVSNDSVPPSNVSLFGKISTRGFGSLGISGTHISASEAQRFNYRVEVLADPSDYWGIGYVMDNNSANKSKMHRVGLQIAGDALFRLLPGFYVGPTVMYDFVRAYKIERPELLEGQRSTTWAGGVGVTLSYDTRDVLTNPHRGVYLTVTQGFYPKFIGNHYAFSRTTLQADWYRRVWHGGILALDFRAEMNYGHPSWYMLASTGGSHYLRGYYEGRYRDKGMVAFQAEVRQRVYRRSGAVLWVGTGTVFSRPSEIMMDRMLPSIGTGYRWEFKEDVNVRLDVGFGKSGQWGVMFNINEAF